MGRDGNGIRKASETSYEIAFTYQGVRCRERIKLKPSPANDRRVSNHLGAILDSIEKGTFNYSVTFPDSKRRFLFIETPGEAINIETYLDDWLEAQEKQLKSSTYNDYRKTINHLIIPQFKGKLLPEIKRIDVKNWVKEMGCSNKRISNILSVFRIALQDAVEDELIETNPLYGWSYENKEAPKKRK
jgi:integrase